MSLQYPTEFNGRKLLVGDREGGLGEFVVQAGISVDATSRISAPLVDSAAFSGVVGFRGDYTGDGDTDAFDVTYILALNLNSDDNTLDLLMDLSGGSLISKNLTDSTGQQRELLILPFKISYL